MSRKITLRDIAQELGVSIGTVDRALHNRGRISQHTRSLVLEAAERLQYKPNKIASALSKKASIRIGAICPTHVRYFYSALEKGIRTSADELGDFGVELHMFKPDYLGSTQELEAVDKCLSMGLDGIIIAPGNPQLHAYNSIFAECGIAVVYVATDSPGNYHLAVVSIDSYRDGAVAGDLLAEFTETHDEIAILTGRIGVRDHDLKIDGFKKSIGDARILVAVRETCDNEEMAYETTRELLSSHPNMKGIYICTANGVGPARAVVDAPRNGVVKVVATDLFEEIMPFVDRRVVSALLYQNPFWQGTQAVRLLYDYLASGILPRRENLLIPTVLTRSSVESVWQTIKSS